MVTTERMSLGHLFLTIIFVALLLFLINIVPQQATNGENQVVRQVSYERLGHTY